MRARGQKVAIRRARPLFWLLPLAARARPLCDASPTHQNPPTQSYLGMVIMFLIVIYHYVTADPRLEQARAQ